MKRFIPGAKLLILFVLASVSFVLLIMLVALFSSNFTKGASVDPDFEVRVAEMLELRVSTCNSSDNSQVVVDIEPSVDGTFKSNCQDVFVNTNSPGYSLLIKSATSTMSYLNPTTITPAPNIASTTNTIASPSALSNDTWGFAAKDRVNFDSSYVVDSDSNNYSQLPTSDTTIYSTSIFPLPETSHTFYYAARLTPSTMAGTYATTVTYTAVGNVVPPAPKTCKNAGTAPECIEFTVDVGSTGTYSIPTSGFVTGSSNHTYDWDVYVDGYLTDICTNGNCTGTSSTTSAGVELTGLSNGQHQILIVPHNNPTPGWGNAFGHYSNTDGANILTNKQKLISIDSSLTTMAFAPKTTESTTNASNMFAYLFFACSNMTNTMSVLDTYKLPGTITNLSNFFASAHATNPKSQAPIDISSLTNWLQANTSITNLSSFFSGVHSGATNLQSPIDFSPVKDWFKSNNSITNLSSFLSHTHNGNSNANFTEPIDLAPFSGWFKSNTSITNLSYFFYGAHTYNSNLQNPINLTPIKDWFKSNNTITDLSHFFRSTHHENLFLQSTLDLSHLSDWFSSNSSITNISRFFDSTHYNNFQLKSPIDVTPLSGWFSANRIVTATTTGIMHSTHYNNYALILNGQVILPEWMMTMKNGNNTPVWNIGQNCDGSIEGQTTYLCSFYRTFYMANNIYSDISEVKFNDSLNTPLSSIGEPSNNLQTYNGRQGITTLFNNSNGRWKNN